MELCTLYIFGLLRLSGAVEDVFEVDVDDFGLFEHFGIDDKYKEEIRIKYYVFYIQKQQTAF